MLTDCWPDNPSILMLGCYLLQVAVLAAPNDSWLSRLGEAADLQDRKLITAAEFDQLKASLVAQLKAAA